MFLDCPEKNKINFDAHVPSNSTCERASTCKEQPICYADGWRESLTALRCLSNRHDHAQTNRCGREGKGTCGERGEGARGLDGRKQSKKQERQGNKIEAVE